MFIAVPTSIDGLQENRVRQKKKKYDVTIPHKMITGFFLSPVFSEETLEEI